MAGKYERDAWSKKIVPEQVTECSKPSFATALNNPVNDEQYVDLT